MPRIATVFKYYTQTNRAIAHVLFWIIMFSMYIVLYNRFASAYSWLFAVKDLLAITVIFYTTSYIIRPRWLLRRKFILSLLWFLVIYLWWATLGYLLCLWIDQYLDSVGERLTLLVDTVLKMGGGFGPINPSTISFYFLDFVYLISLPLGIKLTESILTVRNQTTKLELKNTELALSNTKLELNNVQLELAFLKSQINPHFLFNALNNILILMKLDTDKAIASQRHLTGILGYLVYDTNRAIVPLDEEYAFLENYIALEKIRLHPDTDIQVSLRSDRAYYDVVPLIIFPILENAFKHGPMASGKLASIRFVVHAKSGKLTVEVSNGFKKVSRPAGYKGGVGIENVRRRLQLNYPQSHELRITEENGRYAVFLTINLYAKKHQFHRYLFFHSSIVCSFPL